MFLFPSLALSFPQTIVKSYQTCQSCHITDAGGSLLSDYGRAMSSAFMSVWSVEDEAREFITSESKSFDYRIQYRHLWLSSKAGGEIEFPMFGSIEAAYHRGPLTFDFGWGRYGRLAVEQSRSNFIQYRPVRWISMRAGFFMPTYGLGTNDHTLQIKRAVGLSRGGERYAIETSINVKGKARLFFTATAPSYRFAGNQYGTYEIITPYDQTEYWGKVGGFFAKRLEVGASAKGSRPGVAWVGLYSRYGFGKSSYVMSEYNYNQKQEARVSYVRLGTYFYRGIDLYYERDAFSSPLVEDISHSIGLDVTVRPRFSLSFKVFLGNEDRKQYQTNFWL